VNSNVDCGATPSGTVASDRAQMAGMPCLRLRLPDVAGRIRLTSELIDCLSRSLTSECEARLITIEGVPGSFCEGLDLEALALQHEGSAHSLSPDGVLARFAELLAALQRAPQPVVALVDGAALGGGVGLAAAADLVLASDRASFALPETLMGLIPAMVFPLVARRIGVPRARLLALGAGPLSATAALQVGLIDEITDDLEATLARHARRFSRMDARAVGVMKALIVTHFATPPRYQADAASCFLQLLDSEGTRTRLVRFAAGESPWPEDSVP
jgi:enoyl-CoA hydratase/carnithine racemase